MYVTMQNVIEVDQMVLEILFSRPEAVTFTSKVVVSKQESLALASMAQVARRAAVLQAAAAMRGKVGLEFET